MGFLQFWSFIAATNRVARAKRAMSPIVTYLLESIFSQKMNSSDPMNYTTSRAISPSGGAVEAVSAAEPVEMWAAACRAFGSAAPVSVQVHQPLPWVDLHKLTRVHLRSRNRSESRCIPEIHIFTNAQIQRESNVWQKESDNDTWVQGSKSHPPEPEQIQPRFDGLQEVDVQAGSWVFISSGVLSTKLKVKRNSWVRSLNWKTNPRAGLLSKKILARICQVETHPGAGCQARAAEGRTRRAKNIFQPKLDFKSNPGQPL